MALATLLLLLLLVRFAAVGLSTAADNWNSDRGDQGHYLQLGLDIQQRGFVTDGNRQPLYPALLSTFAGRSWSYFTSAKLMNLAIAALALALFFFVTYAGFGAVTAVLSTALLSANRLFVLHASSVLCEPLLVLFLVAGWWAMARGARARGYWLLAGLLTGLAFETKATGAALALVFVVCLPLSHRIRPVRWTHVAMFCVPCLLVAAPLLAHNYSTYGSPFYNVNTTHWLWMDSGEQSRIADPGQMPTLITYLSSHSAADMVARVGRGLTLAKNLLGYSLLPLGLEEFFRRIYVTWALILIAALLVVFRRRVARYLARRVEASIAVALLLVTTIPLVWFLPVSPEPRFFLPVLPVVLVLLVEAGSGLARSALGARMQRAGARLRGAGAFGLVGALAILAAFSVNVSPADLAASDRAKNAFTDGVLAWLAEGVAEPTGVLFGTSHMLPRWKYSDRLSLHIIPSDAGDWESLEQHARDMDLRHAIVDFETLSARAPLLRPFFEAQGRQVVMRQAPPGWALALVHDRVPADFLVFDLLDQSPIERPLNLILDAGIRLVGYDLRPYVVRPDGVAYLTLYWQASRPISEDYTVFVHLLDPAGALRAQADSQPLRGTFPTTSWPAGLILADRHALHVPPDAPAGPYRIAAGMYRLVSLERLPIRGPDGAGLPDAHALLDGLTVQPDAVTPPR